MYRKTIADLYRAIKDKKVITISDNAIKKIEGLGLNIYKPDLSDIFAELKMMENKSILEIDIKFEVYRDKTNNEHSISILDIIDIKNPQLSLSYIDLKETIKYIMVDPEFLQKEIKNLDLDKLEQERLYRGKFMLQITSWVYREMSDLSHVEEQKTLICQNYGISKFESGE